MKQTQNLILLLALFSVACTIKPPPDADSLGPEASASEINQAFANAQAGFDENKAYRLKDTGKTQLIYKVLSDTFVSETHNAVVIEVTPQHVLYDDNYIMHARNPDESDRLGVIHYEILKSQPSPTPTPQAQMNFDFLPKSLSNAFAFLYEKGRKLWSSVSIEFSTAVGQTEPPKTSFLSVHDLPGHKILENDLQSHLAGSSLTAKASPAPRTSRYFGLRTFKHRFLTNNCSQLADCKVEATHIQYNELTKDANGQDVKFHWIYEISVEAPGLFIVLEECYSTLVKQENSQIPLTVCMHVDNFKYGTAP